MRSYLTFSIGLSLLLTFGCGAPSTPETTQEEILSVEQEGGDSTTQMLELEFNDLELPERPYLVFRQELNLQDMNGFLALESEALALAIAKAGVQPTGHPVNLFYGWDTDRGWGDAAVAMPVAAGTKLDPYVLITLPASRALMLQMEGAYDRLSVAHYALNEEINRLGYQPLPPSVEEYVVGPADTDNPEEFITRIYYNYETPN